MNLNSKRMSALVLAFGLTATACGSDADVIAEQASDAAAQVEEAVSPDDAMADEEAMADDAMAEEDHSDDAMADDAMADLPATVLVETLQGDGPFTVFAPTNAAFEEALSALGITAEELLASDELAEILTYHVVPGKVLAADAIAADGTEVPTVNGDTISVSVVDGNVMVDAATVVAVDLEAGNGVVHVIDSVILPTSWSGICAFWYAFEICAGADRGS